MPPAYKRLNADDCVFLFIDHQSGLIQLVRDFEPHEFRENVLGLVKVAKYFNAPSILTTSFETGPNGPIAQEIPEVLPNAPIIRRPGQINAMDNEDFANAVKATGKQQVVISGVLTEVCVAFPALSLIEQGYDVFIATDASGTFAEHTREAAHKRMVHAGCQLMNWAAIAAELHRDWRRDIAGFGKIWTDHVPGYWCLMQSYQAATENAKK
ncbi:isochorismatase family protein [Aspergillus clavatus NRRL 1]|uniref:Isochorismatase family protein n=1 Tax=Aspergillus clavatus (strain ATCC 1007 / CBS 513.65 / DSM 816 / NCTC 3887 / NRRL 1 / QM 1276 / 107) TaxID=344612 RepID=A1CDJ8_ASPCL|nr:isochorismatase family protein [Aspergillus clavatus NRRL 1]EAW11925.1 isochorismatase family protein [Aspergillus clavatus NRRL 1]